MEIPGGHISGSLVMVNTPSIASSIRRLDETPWPWPSTTALSKLVTSQMNVVVLSKVDTNGLSVPAEDR